MQPPTLMEELIEEILLRLPPDEPASIFRACLVCKPWCRLISGPCFRRMYREFHGAPPMLGFLCGSLTKDFDHITRFMPTCAELCPPVADRRCRLLDARHGRVLLLRDGVCTWRDNVLLVWDPITDEEKEIPMPKLRWYTSSWTAAVVCAAAAGGACGHLDCYRGAFLVVYVASYSSYSAGMFIWTYSSDAGSWSDPIFSQQLEDHVDSFTPSVLLGNALYFESWRRKRVLKYDLEFHEMSVNGLPSSYEQCVGLFRTTDDGRLGFATVQESKLYMWSWKDGAEADAVWRRDRVIELETLLSSNGILTKPVMVGFVERIGVILLRANNALFTVDLKKSMVKKVCDDVGRIHTVVPYMSFCTPAFGGGLRGEGPSSGVSGA